MKYLCYIIMFILLATIAIGMNCTYDSNSYITTTQDVKWSCWLNNFTYGKCYGIVNYENDVIAIYPEKEYITGIGMIDYFEIKEGLINVYFKTTDLYEGYNYTFEVLCGDFDSNKIESFKRTITLVNRDLTEVVYRGIWLKENLPMIFFIVIIISLGITLIWMLTKR